jgi:PAS domain S-box-containing protein
MQAKPSSQTPEAYRDRFFNLSLDMLCIADFDGYFKDLNPSWTAHLGWSLEELKSKPFVEFVHADDRQKTIEEASRLGTGQSTVTFENRYLSKNGEYRWLRWTAYGDIEAQQIFAVAHDITAHKNEIAEKTKIESELVAVTVNLQSIIESSPLPTYALDLSGNVTIWNPACEKVFGWTKQEVLGRPLPIVPIEDIESYRARVEQIFGGTMSMANLESRRLRKDGKIIDVSISASRLCDNKGAVSGIIAITADITEKKQMQSQLIQADRMVAMGTLAAGIAHEINNPLGYCIANLMLAREEIEEIIPESIREKISILRALLSKSEEGAARVRNIVSGLKVFSRNDEEKLEPVDVHSVLESAISMASNEIRHRAELIQDFDTLPRVDGNPGRLGQVFLNLIINAAQAIAEGSVGANQITIKTSTDARGWAVIEVTDTGAGIPEPIINRIFDPFFTTKPIGVGTGLGLSICHGIVTSLRGTITVESQLGHGTTFRVQLPPSTETPARCPKTTSLSPTLNPSRRAKLLIIDDEEGLVEVLARLLSKEHDVTTATDPERALELLLSDCSFDLVFCDLMMPVMNGMELYTKLKESNTGSEKKIIFMSGGAFTQSSIEFMSQVPNMRIEKPFDLQAVRLIVRDFVRSVTVR